MSERTLSARLYQYARLTRLDRPVGSLLLLWPTLWALWLAAGGEPPPGVVLVFVAGVFVMRSAGCVINDFADRRLDSEVARTRHRPLAAGLVAPRDAIVLFAVLILVAFALVLQLNPMTVGLSFAGAALAASYPFMKRVHHLPQLHLGVAFGWGIPMAFTAVTETLPLEAWMLLAANVAWSLAYDTMYAMTDREDDIRFGSRSSAILFGRADRGWIAAAQLTALALLVAVGIRLGMGPAYYGGLAGAAALGAYQQWLIRDREPAACFAAFLNNNWLGAAVFAGIGIDLAMR